MIATVRPTSQIALYQSAPPETWCSRLYGVVNEIFESIAYMYEKYHLRNSPSLFESKLIPATIPNQGNTCFAAAWMQVVASNALLAGAYRSTLRNSFWRTHPAVRVLNEYRARQVDERSRIHISSLRNVFNAPIRASQEDAVELALKIQNDMEMPADGQVRLENRSMAAFGCRMEKWSRSDGAWVAKETRRGVHVYSQPVLSLALSEGGSSILSKIIRDNYWSDMTYERFVDIPNTLTFNLTRHAFAQGGAQANPRKVNAPLYLRLPSQILGGRKSPKYLLQGFVSHDLGSAKGGHYVAYVRAADKFYKMNDGTRTEIRIGEFLRAAKTAYTLNYARTRN